MRYHYKIRSSFDATDIPVDSANADKPFTGYTTEHLANTFGKLELQSRGYNPDQYYIQVYPAGIAGGMWRIDG